MDTPVQPNISSSQEAEANGGYRFALISLTTLFFMWGFITCLNDILIPYLKGAFNLSFTQAMLIQFCFFSAYFIVSLPAGMVVSRIGYQKGIVLGLAIACVGCLLFFPAASGQIYGIFLLALFVLASGITVLQVSANPYVTALGDPKTASSRLTMTQAFNAFGTTVAPFFGFLSYLRRYRRAWRRYARRFRRASALPNSCSVFASSGSYFHVFKAAEAKSHQRKHWSI